MKIAALQLEISDSKTKLERGERVEQAFASLAAGSDRPDLIVLPELWGSGFFNFDQYAPESEPVKGETFQMLSRWAREINCHIAGGSIVEREAEELFNTTLLVNPQGELIATYRKIHLFGHQSAEKELLTAGQDVVTVETVFGVLGLTTCYDLRFPELYRRLVEKGATILLVVAAWPLARVEHWTLLNRTRALENQSFVICCNCCGATGGRPYAGHSMVIDPSGMVLAEAGEQQELLRVEIDLAKIVDTRASFSALRDRVLF